MEVRKRLTTLHALVGKSNRGTKATFNEERIKSDYQRANHHSDLLQGLETRFKHC